MSRADTVISTRKDFQNRIAEFKKAKDNRAQRVYGVLEPTVIDEELLTSACFAQGPKGEAGRLAEEEGIAFDSVDHLALSYQNILGIGGLTQFTSLTVLRLDNNIIERIEGLEKLVNLVRLDLSFNNLQRIENLETLTKLEDLSVFQNKIRKIENLETNKKLRYLSLGGNELDDIENVLYLRRFKSLACLSVEGNPMCLEAGYEKYIFAFLPHLKYLDYKNILPAWRAEAYEKYQIAVDQMQEQQQEEERMEEKAEEDGRYMQRCRAAFVDRVYGDVLFKELFDKDKDGRQLCQVPTIQELVQQYREKIIDACKQLFNSGQEQYQKRLDEENSLRECIQDAKDDSKRRALTSINTYKEKKTVILKKLDEIYQDSYPEITETLLANIRQDIHDLWNELMGNEVSLVDQLEDVITEFGRNLEEKIANFIETIQVCFSKVRESAVAFNERLAELTLTYAERMAKTDGPTDENYTIYADRDFVVNALSNSKDNQINMIDTCEEGIIKGIHNWFNELMEDLHEKEEHARHTNRITEINLYIDAQRVDLETMDLALI